MSRTLYFLTGLAVVWFTAWGIAGWSMNQGAAEKLAHAEHLGTPATSLEHGADVRVEGTIVDGPKTEAPFSQKPCLAAVTRVSIMSRYTDSQGKPASDGRLLTTLRVGPPQLEIAVGDDRLELPLERWTPEYQQITDVDELPARFGVSAETIEREREQLRGSWSGFAVAEATLDAGTHVFVAGRIEDGDGPLRLAPDPVLGEVVLHPGTRAELVEKLGGSGAGLRIAAAILGLGVGPLPLAILGFVIVRRRLRGE